MPPDSTHNIQIRDGVMERDAQRVGRSRGST